MLTGIKPFLTCIIGTNKISEVKGLSYSSSKTLPSSDNDGGILWLMGTLLQVKWSNQISPCKTSPKRRLPLKYSQKRQLVPLILLISFSSPTPSPEADHLYTLLKYIRRGRHSMQSGPCTAPSRKPHQGLLVSSSHPQGLTGPTVKAQYVCTEFPGIYHSRSYFNKNNWEEQNSTGDLY